MNAFTSAILTMFLAMLPMALVADEHTQADIKWQGASAEILAAQLKAVTDEAELTVLIDGNATLYFNAEPAVVAAKIRAVSDNFPAEVKLVGIYAVLTPIPATPKQVETAQAVVSLRRHQMYEFGITLADISAKLKDLGDLTQAANMKKFEGSVVKDANGAEVRLRDIAEVELVAVKRPLVVRGKSDQQDAAPNP